MIMQLKILIILLLISLSFSHKHYKCVFEQLNKDLREQSKKAKPDVSSVQPSTPGRRLLSITRNPMRITLDSSSFNQMKPGLNGAATTTADNLAFVLKTMQVAAFFYMNRLKVYPLTTINAPPVCYDYDTPPNDQTFGISASDLHLYVTYVTDKGASYGANGKSCKYFGDGTTPLPDETLQIGRPTMGRIVFNTYSLVDTANGLTNRLFQSLVSTALHETLHILGMDSTLYSSWLDSDPTSPTFNNVYASTTISATPYIASQRPSTTVFLTTPNVKAWTQTFFGCATAPGMLLENEDSAQGIGFGGGSHWERTAMYDEMMTGTALGAVKYFSGLTLSALRDMGWYTVDSTFNETSNYGYQKGCDFLYKACYGTSFQEFCDPASLASISLCSSSFYSKAICSSDSGLMADGCGLYGPYFNCVDPDSQNDGYQSYTSQVYSTKSFCVTSTLGSVALPSTVQSRCYPYVCNPNNITFTIGTNKITCLSTENATTQKTISAFTGYLACPDYNQFCVRSRKTCPNWCSKNGYCMGGICNCITGYYGDDCSKTTCTTGLYYNPLSGTCVSICPNGYYQNPYNTACEKCASSCQQCYGEPTTCTGCVSTANNPQYFYNATNATNVCFSVCPDGTYASSSGYLCLPCDSAGAYCKTCSITATNCTSCTSGRFLSQPLFGTCLTSCPTTGTYSVSDLVNFQCVSTCANNLVLVNMGNNNNTCQFCPNSTYKYTANSSCISSCPNFYYANNQNWLCSPCDSSCLTCSGGLAENCNSCSPSATLRYLLLKMCWSVCPGGYYPNNTASVCQLCPFELKCGNCTLINSTMTVYCTSCAYGYFYQSSTKTCESQCGSTQYANAADNTCLSCDSTCKTCTGPTSSQCSSCNAPLLFKANVTGGYCVSSCPALGYYNDSGVSCTACDPSCVTCSGGGNTKCTSCFNNTYLSSGYCRMVCPPAQFPSDANNRCLACDGSCTFCFGSTIDNCTACITGMVLWNFTCMTNCPKGYTVNQWNVCFEMKLQVLASFAVLVLMAIFL